MTDVQIQPVDNSRRMDIDRVPGLRLARFQLEGKSMTRLWLLLALAATFLLSACQVVGDIFQAGMAVGVFMVVAVIALIGFLIVKARS